jgi:hypothetical protein
MANLKLKELEEALEVMSDGGSAAAARDKFVRLGAFHSRRGIGNFTTLAKRVYTLSGGLQREGPPAAAFQALWGDFMHKRLSEDSGGKLDELAQAINEHLDDSEQIKEGAQAELETALENYETFLATKVGGPAARLDTLQKALPEVADILRGKPVQDAIAEPDELDHDHDH